jgi:D-sedoheptulose 7-phosphate isomerase
VSWLKPRQRDPKRPLRFDTPRAEPAFGIAWFRPEQWDRLREISADRDGLEETYDEWLTGACRRFAEMTEGGLPLRKVDVDVEHLAEWCAQRNVPVNGESRSQYAAFMMRSEPPHAAPPPLGDAGEAEPSAPTASPTVSAKHAGPAAGPTGAAIRASTPAAGGRASEIDLDAYFAERAALLGTIARAMGAEIARAADLATETIRGGGTLYFFGNGGSAADAQHLATELVERLTFDRRGFRAHALTTNTSLLTATANDRTFDDVFARQVEVLARPGDLLVAISTSGKSPNVLRALEAGRRAGVARLGFTGKGGGEMRGLCDVCLVVPSDDTQKIQELHIAIGHFLCMTVENRLAR